MPPRRNRASLELPGISSLLRRSWKMRSSTIHCLAYDIWITFWSWQRVSSSHKYSSEWPTSFVRCSIFNQGQSFLILAWLKNRGARIHTHAKELISFLTPAHSLQLSFIPIPRSISRPMLSRPRSSPSRWPISTSTTNSTFAPHRDSGDEGAASQIDQ
jgi:hypothetical protein